MVVLVVLDVVGVFWVFMVVFFFGVSLAVYVGVWVDGQRQ